MILGTRGTRLASNSNLSITMDQFRLKGQSLQWIASLLFITIVASADEGPKGAIIYNAVRGSDDSLAKPLEFTSVEVFPQVVNYTPVGSQAKQRVMQSNVVAVVEFPNLSAGTYTTDAQFEDLRKKGAEIKALSDRYPATKASFNPVIQAIADALSRHQAGEVLVSGQWTAKSQQGKPMVSSPPGKGAIPELAVTDELGRTRTYKNVKVTSVGPASVQISHSSGAASIPVEKLPKDILDSPEVAAKLADARKREAERVAALTAAKEAVTPDASAAEPLKQLIGTWIYIGQDMKWENPRLGLVRYTWMKWVIREDGMVERYWAKPTDTDWGKPTIAKYEVVNGKYSNTGESYFGIRVPSVASEMGIAQRDGSIRYVFKLMGSFEGTKNEIPETHYDVMLIRGDKNPFTP